MIEFRNTTIRLDWRCFAVGVCVYVTAIQIFIGPIDINIDRNWYPE